MSVSGCYLSSAVLEPDNMNPENSAIKQSLPALKKFLLDCPKEAADAFFSKELIPEELKNKVYGDSGNVGDLIRCLSGKIENDPSIFVKVLEVLVGMAGSEPVSIMKEKYGMHKSRDKSVGSSGVKGDNCHLL